MERARKRTGAAVTPLWKGVSDPVSEKLEHAALRQRQVWALLRGHLPADFSVAIDSPTPFRAESVGVAKIELRFTFAFEVYKGDTDAQVLGSADEARGVLARSLRQWSERHG